MATKIDKAELAQRINSLEGLDNETKSQLLELLHERKQYGLVWEDKPEAAEERLQNELPILREVKERAIISDDPAAPNHILIEGDNLEALTTLSYTHEGKIDVIYIDPPYNTGNKDFVYNDSYVDTEDQFRHSKWLSFMAKRLKIAKRLLSDKGVIFISINENEVSNLRLLGDEIFSERNFVTFFIWHNNKKGRQMDKYIKTTNEYVLMYSRNIDNLVIKDKKVDIESNDYKFFDEISAYKKGYPLHNGTAAFHIDNRPNLCYTIYYNPLTKHIVTIDEKVGSVGNWDLPISEQGYSLLSRNYIRILPKRNSKYGTQRVWRWGQEKTNRESSELMFLQEDDGWYIYQKERVEDSGQKTVKYTNYLEIDTSRGRSTLNDIFDNRVVFDFPKPVELVTYLVNMLNSDSTILDFFAGSGTTLHATMQLNAEDGGKRQCILVTNNENNICEEVTYERNKRVINGYTTPKGEQVEGLHANTLRYYKTDFVARESSATAKRELMYAATEMLCIKNNIYTEQSTFGSRKFRKDVCRYFADGERGMLIIYNPDAIEVIAEELKKMQIEQPILVYVFSLNDYAMDADFEDVSEKVSLCALPAAILNAYRKVLPKKQRKEDTL